MNRNRWSSLILTTLACAMVAQAQQSQTSGAIRGQISARKGGSLAGAKVVVRNLETSFTRTIMTGTDGVFSAPLLPVGLYEITVSAQGMKTLKDANVRVNLGNTSVMNFTLDASEVGATVEVVGTATVALDAQQVNTVATVNQDVVESVPLVNRNFQDLAKLTPGMVGGSGNPPRLISEGGRQIFNAVQIDGANNNSLFFAEQRGGAFIPFTFGADTIKELQVVTNGYDAQYQQAGATVNAISKSGSNKFEGSVLAEFRNSRWTAKATPVPGANNSDLARTRINDSHNLNFNVGGPILRDKLFFFAGVETFNKKFTANPQNPYDRSAGNTDADFDAFRNSALGQVVSNKKGLTIAQEFGSLGLNGLPSPNPYSMEATNTVYFGRLDYNLNADHRFVFRANYTVMDDSYLNTSNNPNNAESNIITAKISAISWVLEANDIWSSELFTESRLQLAREARPMRANAVAGVPSIQVGPSSSALTVGTKTSTPRESNELITQFFSQTTWNRGDWTVKGGVDYLKADEDNQFYQNNAGNFNFSTYAMAAAWASGTITSTTPGTISYQGAISPYAGRILMWTSMASGFGQASYNGLLDRRLNLTLGLRYTKQDFSKNPNPNPYFAELDQASGATAVDPRFAFTFDVDGKGKTIIRGGYGWFSSPTPLLIHSNTMNNNGLMTANYAFSLPAVGASRTAAILNEFNTGGRIAASGANGLISGTSMTKVNDANLRALSTSGLFGSGSGLVAALYDPDQKMSVAKKLSLGVDHDLGDGLILGSKASYIRYENLQYYVNVNLGQTGGTAYNDGYSLGNDTWSRATRPGYAIIRGRRVDFTANTTNPAGFSDVFLSRGDGYGKYMGLTFTAQKKFSENAGFLANVTFSRAWDTTSSERATPTSGLTPFPSSPFGEIGSAQLPNPASVGSSYGISNNDRLMVFNAVAYFPVILGIDASLRYNYQTGLPFTAYDGRDLNGDGVANHFALSGRNTERQPNSSQLDLRLTRSFAVYKKVHLEAILDVYNVFNTAYNAISTSKQVATTSTGLVNLNYGKQDTLDLNTRELQVGIRLKF